MMQFFRSLSGKIVAALFAVLMLVFLWTSVDWSNITGGSRTSVGEINGVSIQLRNYQAMVQQEIEGRQRQEGRSLSQEETEEVRNRVWDDLVQSGALDREFRRRNIAVTPDEIAAAIQSSPPPEFLRAPDFQTDGQFDASKYQRWLQSSAAVQYIPVLEAQYADQLRRNKLFRVVTADIYLSDAALWELYRDENEKVTVELAAIVPRNAVPDSAVPLTDAELRGYYDAHRDDFKRPATAFLSYVQVPRLPDASDTTAARDRAIRLVQELRGGAPFAEVATRESADSASAAQGGDLGEFGRHSMDPAFERAAFSLPVGRISDPVLSAFGFHLIKVERRAGDKVRARHILIPIEIVGAHRERLDARADSLEALASEQLNNPAALDSAARALDLRVGRASPLQQGSRVQVGLQLIPDAGVWAFQAKLGETGRIVELSYAYFLFRLDSLQPEGVPPFERIRGAVEIAARNDKKWVGARAIATDFAKRLAEGSSLAQAATALGLPHQEYPAFTRIQPPLPNPRVVGTAFGLPPGKVSGALDTDEGIYFIRVLRHEQPDSAVFAQNLDEFRARQIRLAQQERVRNFLIAIKEAAKVEDRRAAIFTTGAQSDQGAKTGRS